MFLMKGFWVASRLEDSHSEPDIYSTWVTQTPDWNVKHEKSLEG
jgi:hypothetical protein